MRIPRDITAKELIKALRKSFDYEVTRQNGSHITVTTMLNGQHHLSIPNHSPLKIGMLNDLLDKVSKHFEISKEEVVRKLF
jgi:predicted RNA binding protein YcfA (HicA-like mRNA interferase family)